MRNLIAIPIVILTVILQSAIVSRLPLLDGSADLSLVVLAAWALQDGVETAWHWALAFGLLVGFVSALPFFVPVVGYLFIALLARGLQARVWQIPLLAMLSVCLIGTAFFHAISLGALKTLDAPLEISNALGWITLPSMLLNSLLAIPVFTVMRDLARWVHPPLESE